MDLNCFLERLMEFVFGTNLEITAENVLWIGNASSIYAHAVLPAFLEVLLHQECTSFKEERIFNLILLLYPTRAASYIQYLREELELAQVKSLLELNSLIGMLQSKDKTEIALLAKLIQGNPRRKELLILALLDLYQEAGFMNRNDSALQLGKKYLLVFEMLQCIDSTGFFLQIFSLPFKELFLAKAEAIQVIVEEILLLQPENAQLYENASLESTICELQWKPDPIEAEYVKILNSYKFGDVFSIFVNLWEGKHEFIRKFDDYFAQKIINSLSGKSCLLEEFQMLQSILRRMNKRFGVDLTHKANVMLHDLKETVQIFKAKNCLVISGLYWPNVKTFAEGEREAELMEKMQNSSLSTQIESINAIYHQANPAKRLHFQWNLGFVEFQADGKSFKTSPLDFFVLNELASRENCSFSQIKAFTSIEQDTLLESLWNLIQLGLVHLTDENCFKAELCSQPSRINSFQQLEELIFPSSSASSASGCEFNLEKLKFYSGYVQGILTNIGSMNLERLFGVLQRFLQGPAKFFGTCDDLKQLLEYLQRQGIIKEANGEYSICKAPENG